jgi:hypothetical protein
VGMILQKAFDGLRFILNIFFHSGAESWDRLILGCEWCA